MSNLFDYLKWRGDLDFVQSPLNPVDNIILCQIAYLPFDGIVPGPEEKQTISVKDAIEILYKKMHNKDASRAATQNAANAELHFVHRPDPALVNALRPASRFGNCRLCGYVNHIDTEREIQFSALCINTGDGSWFVAYRGTDLTFVGWKEDFNMSFSEVVPAQLAAADYLEKMAKKIKGPLRIGGHSKGGNLAIYAASQCCKKIQRRITAVYSNDSPGFHKRFIAGEGYAAVRERIHAFIPQSSVVGMLLERGNDYTVIKSSQAGLLQHEMYTWEVTHNDMVRVDDITLVSRFVDKTLREWIAALDNTHREQFIGALYTILSASQAKSIHELERSWPQSVGRMLQSLGEIDDPTKQLIGKALGAFLQSARNNIHTLLKK